MISEMKANVNTSWVEVVNGVAFLTLKFIHSEKASKFCKISTLLLSYVVPVKIKVEILQNFVAFSEYMNLSMLEKCGKNDARFVVSALVRY